MHSAATEELVRRFFVDYTERYSMMDLDGFLSLFSRKAVQNRIHGLKDMKKIYRDFFDQSVQLRYFLEDMKVEIHPGVVEIKGRYVLVQAPKKASAIKVWRGKIEWVLIREDGALKVLSLDYHPQESS